MVTKVSDSPKPLKKKLGTLSSSKVSWKGCQLLTSKATGIPSTPSSLD